MNVLQLTQVKHSGWYFCSPATCLYRGSVLKHNVEAKGITLLLQDGFLWGEALGTALNEIFLSILTSRPCSIRMYLEDILWFESWKNTACTMRKPRDRKAMNSGMSRVADWHSALLVAKWNPAGIIAIHLSVNVTQSKYLVFVWPVVRLKKWWLWLINKAAIFKLAHHYRSVWYCLRLKCFRANEQWALTQDCLLCLLLNEMLVRFTKQDHGGGTGQVIRLFPYVG